VCGYDGACTTKPIVWSFTVAAQPDEASGDTSIPAGFGKGKQ